jgi:hypothetical protein
LGCWGMLVESIRFPGMVLLFVKSIKAGNFGRAGQCESSQARGTCGVTMGARA